MDKRIQRLMDDVKVKFGLEIYYLQEYRLDRSVTIFNETYYTLNMVWIPDHVTAGEEDDLNPEGTAVIDIDIHSEQVISAIFVAGKTFARGGIRFPDTRISGVIRWLEQETGLTYHKQFQLFKEQAGELYFRKCVDGVALVPSGYMEIKWDPAGNLTFFANHGQIPLADMVLEENFSLSLDMLDDEAKEQLKLIEFPSWEQQRFVSVYAIEEIYITNDRTMTIPFENFDKSYVQIDKTIHWDQPLAERFAPQEIQTLEEITVEQAFSSEPAPDSLPITTEERERCISEVKNFLRKKYSHDTGKWILRTLHRERGYIHALLNEKHQKYGAFQRKLSIILEAESFQAINYTDNQSMLDMFESFQAADPATVTKDQALAKIKGMLELEPRYVYDFHKKQYILCGKLDCPYGVNASTGEVVALKNL